MKIDVVIPLKSTNDNTISNISSISKFKECGTIYVGNAGVEDDILKALSSIDNLIIVDHKSFKSLGGSIKDLISHVKTELFAYFHADVKIPQDWFIKMQNNMKSYDFAECLRKYHFDIITFPEEKRYGKKFRALSGSQMGKTNFVRDSIKNIDDDYLYRYEDHIIAELIRINGGNYGIIEDTFHLHEMSHKNNESISSDINIIHERIPSDKDVIAFDNQICGIVKYCSPFSKINLWHHDYSLTVLKHYDYQSTDLKYLLSKNKIWFLIYLTWRPRMILRKFIKIFKIIISKNLSYYHK